MKYNKLGRTGLDVSRLCLGCMTFGDPKSGAHPWTIGEEEARPIFRQAVENGMTFFDTSNSYSAGTSEVIVGKLVKEFTRRQEVVIATKAFFPPEGGISPASAGKNIAGLSRKAVLSAVDESLKRLGTDYIDLYQLHRWDYDTPIEETMEVMHDLVKSGKVRYIGASSMYAWQFAKAQEIARKNGWTTFVSMQNYVNLLYREEEREMIPLCKDQGVGLMTWSPLARGKLARPVGTETQRSNTDEINKKLFSNTIEADNRVIRSVSQVADERGVPMAQIALAWVLRKPEVSSPIVGASRPDQLNDAIAALDIELSDEEIRILEEHYVPHSVMGHS